MGTSLAPVALFVYNRPDHTLRTLKALKHDYLAKDTVLYVFCDGPKAEANPEGLQKIRSVREVVQKEQWCKEVIIQYAEHNLGLEKSIRKGIAEVFTNYTQIIVLEDDILVHPYFLTFMNKALTQYESEEKVKQISGYVEHVWHTNSLEAFFMPHPSSWGWATWKRVWDSIDFEADDYQLVKKNKKLAHTFDLNGAYPYSKMLINQKEKAGFNSWAILFCWSIFKQKGIVLYPTKSLVVNLGFDGSGFHGDQRNETKESFEGYKNDIKITYLPKPEINSDLLNKIRRFYTYGMVYSSRFGIVNYLKLKYLQLLSFWKLVYISLLNIKYKFF